MQSHYDEVTRQLQQAIDQLGVAQRRCQTLQMELDEMRSALEQVSKLAILFKCIKVPSQKAVLMNLQGGEWSEKNELLVFSYGKYIK